MLVYLKDDIWVFPNEQELPSDAVDLAQEAFMMLKNKIEGERKSKDLPIDSNEDYGVVWKPNPTFEPTLDKAEGEESLDTFQFQAIPGCN